MMLENWYADGYLLTNCGVRDIVYGSSVYTGAGKRGDNTTVAQRNGDIWRPKMYESSKFTLNMYVYSPRGQEFALDAYRELLRVMTRQDGLVEFMRVWDDGSRRYRCFGEVLQSVAPTNLGPRGFRMGFEVNVPGAFWESVDAVVHTYQDSPVLPQTVTLTNHADSTAPIDDMRFVVTGPITNPGVELVRTGTTQVEQWSYSGVVAAGQTLTVDAGTWAVTGTGGLIVDQARISYTGNRYLTVQPHRPNDIVQAPQVRLTGSSGTSATRLSTVARSKVLV